jgi:hypothetical protein
VKLFWLYAGCLALCYAAGYFFPEELGPAQETKTSVAASLALFIACLAYCRKD